MWLVLLISFLIQSSQELDCGMLLENTNFALEGAGDLIAPWVVSMGIYEGTEYKVKCTGAS